MKKIKKGHPLNNFVFILIIWAILGIYFMVAKKAIAPVAFKQFIVYSLKFTILHAQW